LTQSYTIQLGFGTDQGRRYTITLPGADPFLDADDIRVSMQEIIDSNVIITTNGTLVERQSAKIIRTERVDVAVA